MHCELVVPGLLGAAAQARLPAAELVFARGRAVAEEPLALERWLAARFGLEADDALAAGALTRLAHGRPAEAAWARADPVHLHLLRERMVLVPGRGLSIALEEAQRLCATLNTHFAGRLAFDPVEPARWCVRIDGAATTYGASPEEKAGATVEPQGAADVLANEIQMALHEHAVNEAREARGEPALNGVWLWGAGALPAGLQGPWHSVSADDPLARGLAQAAGIRARPLPASAIALLERAPEDGRHLVVLDALRLPLALGDVEATARQLAALEAGWFSPLLGALRAGRVGMLSLHVPEAGRCVEATRGDLRRFWRRPGPLARRAA